MSPSLLALKKLGDTRGSLTVIEAGKTVPFPIQRVYYLYGTVAGVERGFHAHKQLKQMAVAVSGSCEMILDDGKTTVSVTLDSPSRGIYIPPKVWHVMKNFSPDCVLMVVADAHYDESDYIRDYKTYLDWLETNS